MPIPKVASNWYWSRIRKVDNRINLIKMQENPQTTKEHREVTGKPAAATSTLEYKAYLIVQSNNRTRITEKRSKSWFSSSRTTRTSSFSCRTWKRPKRWIRLGEKSKKLITDMGNTEIFELCETSSKKRCPDCALYWETDIVYWSCGRCLIPSQKYQKVGQEELWRLINSRLRHPHPWCQTWSFRAATNVTTKPRRCCRKLANPNMMGTKPHWKDGTMVTNDRESLSKVGWTGRTDYSVWRTCTGRSLRHCNKRRKRS